MTGTKARKVMSKADMAKDVHGKDFLMTVAVAEGTSEMETPARRPRYQQES